MTLLKEALACEIRLFAIKASVASLNTVDEDEKAGVLQLLDDLIEHVQGLAGGINLASKETER